MDQGRRQQPQNGQRNNDENQQGRGLDLRELMRMFFLLIFMQMAFQIFLDSMLKSNKNRNSQNYSNNTTMFSQPADGFDEEMLSVEATAKGVLPKQQQQQQQRKPHIGLAVNSLDHNSLWRKGTVMNLDIFISEDSSMLSPSSSFLSSWHEKDLILGDSSSLARNVSLTVDISEKMKANETRLFGHLYLTRQKYRRKNGSTNSNKPPEMNEENRIDTLYKRFDLTKYKFRGKKSNKKNLLEADDNTDDSRKNTKKKKNSKKDEEIEDNTVLGLASKNTEEDAILLYVKPSLMLQLVDFEFSFPRGQIPPNILDYFDFYMKEYDFNTGISYEENKSKILKEAPKAGADYYPLLHPSDFWLLDEKLVAVNGTLDEVTISFDVDFTPFWKFTLMAQMEAQWKMQEKLTGGGESDFDMFRSILLDNNPVILAITFCITLLHSLFDMLAFKNDISFFKGKTNMEGLSVRSMIINSFFQVVIFLYLFDNDTSYMVLVSNGIGILIEFWKISKALKIGFDTGTMKIIWSDDKDEGKKQSKSKEYDDIAVRHLLYFTMPTVLGYGIYSLKHQKHKNYYSWILSTLVGFIYMFGFVMMTPQLFINYKLKSVAHLNWRTMTYKSLNTFIDDLFAFIVKMPVMHRLACLRDDFIFLIFLYQRYIYRTDFTRVNEFGQCSQPSEEMLKEIGRLDDNNIISISDRQSSTNVEIQKSSNESENEKSPVQKKDE